MQKAANELNKITGGVAGKEINFKVNGKSFTQPLGRISSSANEFTKSLEASNARVIAFGASVGIINGITDSFKFLVTETIRFEKTLKDINAVLNASNQQLQQFGQGLFDVAQNTAQGFNIAADAALEFSRQGLSTEEVLKRTNDALTLTRITSLDAASAVSGLTAAVNAFGKAGLTTTEIIDKLAAVDVKFAVSSEDLINGLSRAGAVAIDAGVSLDSLIAIITSLQQTTARGGAVIGNGLKTIFTRIQRPESIKQLEKMDLRVRDLTGAILPADTILKNIAKSFKGLTQAQQSNIVQFSAGIFQANIFRAALKDLSKAQGIQEQALNISANAAGEAARKNELLNKSLAALASRAGTGLQELVGIMGELTVKEDIGGLLDVFGKTIEGLKNSLGGGEKEGNTFAKGLVRGIGNVITGPGMIAFVAIFSKLLINVFKFAGSSLKDVLGIVSQKEKIRNVEEAILRVLGSNKQVTQSLNNLEGDRLAQEKYILGIIEAQTNAMAQQQRLARVLSRPLVNAGIDESFSVTPVDGQMQDLNQDGIFQIGAAGVNPEAARKEKSGAAKGGYSPGAISQTKIAGIGNVVFNKAESVKQFPGMKQSAIMPPQKSRAGRNYGRAFGERHGFDPYASGGFVPNFFNQSTWGANDPRYKGSKSAQLSGTMLKLPPAKMMVETTKQDPNTNKKMAGWHYLEAAYRNIGNMKTIRESGLDAAFGGLNVTALGRAVYHSSEDLPNPKYPNKYQASGKAAGLQRAARRGTRRQRRNADNIAGSAYEGTLFDKSLKGQEYNETWKGEYDKDGNYIPGDGDKDANIDFFKIDHIPLEAKFGAYKDPNVMGKSIKLSSDSYIEDFLRANGQGGAAEAMMAIKRGESIKVLKKLGRGEDELEASGLSGGLVPNFVPPRQTAAGTEVDDVYQSLKDGWDVDGYRMTNKQLEGIHSFGGSPGNPYKTANWWFDKDYGAKLNNKGYKASAKPSAQVGDYIKPSKAYDAMKKFILQHERPKGGGVLNISDTDLYNKLVGPTQTDVLSPSAHRFSEIINIGSRSPAALGRNVTSYRTQIAEVDAQKSSNYKGSRNKDPWKSLKIQKKGSEPLTAYGSELDAVYPGISKGAPQSFLGLKNRLNIKKLRKEQKRNFDGVKFDATVDQYGLHDGSDFLPYMTLSQPPYGLNAHGYESAIVDISKGRYKAGTASAPLDFIGRNLGEAKFGSNASKEASDQHLVGKLLRHKIGSGLSGWPLPVSTRSMSLGTLDFFNTEMSKGGKLLNRLPYEESLSKKKERSRNKDAHGASQGFIPNFMLMDTLFPPPIRPPLPPYQRTADSEASSGKGYHIDPPRKKKPFAIPKNPYAPSGGTPVSLYRHGMSIPKKAGGVDHTAVDNAMRSFHGGQVPLKSFTSLDGLKAKYREVAGAKASEVSSSYFEYLLNQSDLHDLSATGGSQNGIFTADPARLNHLKGMQDPRLQGKYQRYMYNSASGPYAGGLIPNFVRGLFDFDYMPKVQDEKSGKMVHPGKQRDAIVNSIMNGGLPYDVVHGVPGAGKSTFAQANLPGEMITSLKYFQDMKDQWNEFALVSGTRRSRTKKAAGAPSGLAQYSDQAQAILKGARKVFAMTPSEKTLGVRRSLRMKQSEMGKLPDARSRKDLATSAVGGKGDIVVPDSLLYDQLEELGIPVNRISSGGYIPNFQLNKVKGKIATPGQRQLERDLTDAKIANKRPGSSGDKHIIDNNSPHTVYSGKNHDLIAKANGLNTAGALGDNYIKTFYDTLFDMNQKGEDGSSPKHIPRMTFSSVSKNISSGARAILKGMADDQGRVLNRNDSWARYDLASRGKQGVVYDPLGQAGEAITNFNKGLVPNFASYLTSAPKKGTPQSVWWDYKGNRRKSSLGSDDVKELKEVHGYDYVNNTWQSINKTGYKLNPKAKRMNRAYREGKGIAEPVRLSYLEGLMYHDRRIPITDKNAVSSYNKERGLPAGDSIPGDSYMNPEFMSRTGVKNLSDLGRHMKKGGGLESPLIIGYDSKQNKLQLIEGHHRLAAGLESNRSLKGQGGDFNRNIPAFVSGTGITETNARDYSLGAVNLSKQPFKTPKQIPHDAAGKGRRIGGMWPPSAFGIPNYAISSQPSSGLDDYARKELIGKRFMDLNRMVTGSILSGAIGPEEIKFKQAIFAALAPTFPTPSGKRGPGTGWNPLIEAGNLAKISAESRKKLTGYLEATAGSAHGLVPNFADPLSNAIKREKAAGVPSSKIRVSRSAQLKGPGNPMGLAVTNTRDEPAGIAQGIKRARERGIDPKRHGAAKGLVPNFATPTPQPLGGDYFKALMDSLNAFIVKGVKGVGELEDEFSKIWTGDDPKKKGWIEFFKRIKGIDASKPEQFAAGIKELETAMGTTQKEIVNLGKKESLTDDEAKKLDYHNKAYVEMEATKTSMESTQKVGGIDDTTKLTESIDDLKTIYDKQLKTIEQDFSKTSDKGARKTLGDKHDVILKERNKALLKDKEMLEATTDQKAGDMGRLFFMSSMISMVSGQFQELAKSASDTTASFGKLAASGASVLQARITSKELGGQVMDSMGVQSKHSFGLGDALGGWGDKSKGFKQAEMERSRKAGPGKGGMLGGALSKVGKFGRGLTRFIPVLGQLYTGFTVLNEVFKFMNDGEGIMSLFNSGADKARRRIEKLGKASEAASAALESMKKLEEKKVKLAELEILGGDRTIKQEGELLSLQLETLKLEQKQAESLNALTNKQKTGEFGAKLLSKALTGTANSLGDQKKALEEVTLRLQAMSAVASINVGFGENMNRVEDQEGANALSRIHGANFAALSANKFGDDPAQVQGIANYLTKILDTDLKKRPGDMDSGYAFYDAIDKINTSRLSNLGMDTDSAQILKDEIRLMYDAVQDEDVNAVDEDKAMAAGIKSFINTMTKGMDISGNMKKLVESTGKARKELERRVGMGKALRAMQQKELSHGDEMKKLGIKERGWRNNLLKEHKLISNAASIERDMMLKQNELDIDIRKKRRDAESKLTEALLEQAQKAYRVENLAGMNETDVNEAMKNLRESLNKASDAVSDPNVLRDLNKGLLPGSQVKPSQTEKSQAQKILGDLAEAGKTTSGTELQAKLNEVFYELEAAGSNNVSLLIQMALSISGGIPIAEAELAVKRKALLEQEGVLHAIQKDKEQKLAALKQEEKKKEVEGKTLKGAIILLEQFGKKIVTQESINKDMLGEAAHQKVINDSSSRRVELLRKSEYFQAQIFESLRKEAQENAEKEQASSAKLDQSMAIRDLTRSNNLPLKLNEAGKNLLKTDVAKVSNEVKNLHASRKELEFRNASLAYWDKRKTIANETFLTEKENQENEILNNHYSQEHLKFGNNRSEVAKRILILEAQGLEKESTLLDGKLNLMKDIDYRAYISQGQVNSELKQLKYDNILEKAKFAYSLHSGKLEETARETLESEILNLEKDALMTASKNRQLSANEGLEKRQKRAQELLDMGNKLQELKNAEMEANIGQGVLNDIVDADMQIKKFGQRRGTRQAATTALHSGATPEDMLSFTEQLKEFNRTTGEGSGAIDQLRIKMAEMSLSASNLGSDLVDIGIEGARSGMVQLFKDIGTGAEGATEAWKKFALGLAESILDRMMQRNVDKIINDLTYAFTGVDPEKEAQKFLRENTDHLKANTEALDRQTKSREGEIRGDVPKPEGDYEAGLARIKAQILEIQKEHAKRFADMSGDSIAIMDAAKPSIENATRGVIDALTASLYSVSGKLNGAERKRDSRRKLLDAQLSSEINNYAGTPKGFEGKSWSEAYNEAGSKASNLISISPEKVNLALAHRKISEEVRVMEKAMGQRIPGAKVGWFGGGMDENERLRERLQTISGFQLSKNNTFGFPANQSGKKMRGPMDLVVGENEKLYSGKDMPYSQQNIFSAKNVQTTLKNDAERLAVAARVNEYFEDLDKAQKGYYAKPGTSAGDWKAFDNMKMLKEKFQYGGKESIDVEKTKEHQSRGAENLRRLEDRESDLSQSLLQIGEKEYIDELAQAEARKEQMNILLAETEARRKEYDGIRVNTQSIFMTGQQMLKNLTAQTLMSKDQLDEYNGLLGEQNRLQKELNKLNQGKLATPGLYTGAVSPASPANNPMQARAVVIDADRVELRGALEDLKDANITGNYFLGGGRIQKFAEGGFVNGPVGRDQVPAMLTAGEYVVPKDKAQKFAPGGKIRDGLSELNNKDSDNRFVRGTQGIVRAAVMYETSRLMSDAINKKQDKPPTFNMNKLNQLDLGSDVSMKRGDSRLSSKFLANDPVMEEYRGYLMDKAAYSVQKKNEKFKDKQSLASTIIGAFTSFMTAEVVGVAKPYLKRAADWGKAKVGNTVKGHMGFGKHSDAFKSGRADGRDFDYKDISYNQKRDQYSINTMRQKRSFWTNKIQGGTQGSAWTTQDGMWERDYYAEEDYKIRLREAHARAAQRKKDRELLGQNLGGAIPAMLTAGEGFIPASTAKRIGYGNLDAMNRTGSLPIIQGRGGVDNVGPVGLSEGDFIIRKSSTDKLMKENPNMMRFALQNPDGFKRGETGYYEGGIVGTDGATSISQPGLTGSSSGQPVNRIQPLMDAAQAQQKEKVTHSQNNEVTNNINVNVTIDSSGNERVEAESTQGSYEQEKALAMKIKSSVLEVIREEKRLGGELDR
jgi:TP901 family phage tail tape measure protein